MDKVREALEEAKNLLNALHEMDNKNTVHRTVALIDAAFAKVREECADRAYEALVAMPTDTPRPIYAASIARAAILGKDR